VCSQKKNVNTGNGIIADLTGLIHDQDVDSCSANNSDFRLIVEKNILNLIIKFFFDFF
jgi:hypothetical protein